MLIEVGTAGGLSRYRALMDEVREKHGLLAFPTDTVNGIGCSIYDDVAVRKLISLKGRASSKGFAVLACDLDSVSRIARLDGDSLALARRFWPGNLTLLLPLKDRRVSKLVHKGERIALRIPANELTRGIAKAFGGAIIGTSANLSGKEPIPTIESITERFPEIDLAIESKCRQSGKASTIYDADGKRVVREGEIGAEEIRRTIKGVRIPAKSFSRRKEDFTCGHCGNVVKGEGYTNHCPKCLWSRHVDNNPGDRRCACNGLMEPVRTEYSRSGFTIVHRCTRCGTEKRCKASPDDNPELLEKLSAN